MIVKGHLNMRTTLFLVLACIMAAPVSAQQPQVVRDRLFTGTVAVFIDSKDANQLRFKVADSAVKAGYMSVKQVTNCGNGKDGWLAESDYTWDLMAKFKNSRQQASVRSGLRNPERDADGKVVSYDYDILLREQDSSTLGRATVTYDPGGSWMMIQGDSADPGRFHFVAQFDLMGRLASMLTQRREFDWDNKKWLETTSLIEERVMYDEMGRTARVDMIVFSEGALRHSHTVNTFNDHGFLIERNLYSDSETSTCSGERFNAEDMNQMENGMYLFMQWKQEWSEDPPPSE